MRRTIRVLLIEERSDVAECIKSFLHNIDDPRSKLMWTDSIVNGSHLLTIRRFDVVLLSLRGDDRSSPSILRKLLDKNDAIPILTLDEYGESGFSRRCLENGSQYHLATRDLSTATLGRAIAYAMRRHRLMRQFRATRGLADAAGDRLHKVHDDPHQPECEFVRELRVPLAVIREEQVADSFAPPSGRQCSASSLIKEIQSTLDRRASDRGIDLDFTITEPLPDLYCDPDSVCAMMANLVDKAIELTSESGHVHIWFREDFDSDCVVVGVTCRNDLIRKQSDDPEGDQTSVRAWPIECRP